MTDLTDLRARAEALLTTRPGVDKYQQGEPSDALCCEDYDVLVGPGGYVDFLGEPEDRSWCRDAACAVARLNELHSLAADLLAALPPDTAPVGVVAWAHYRDGELSGFLRAEPEPRASSARSRFVPLVAALPPDTAPTGERRPCEAWVTLKDAPGYKLVEARLGGLRLAAWWSAILPMQQPVAWEVSDVQRVIAHDSAGDNIVTLEAAQLAAEDAAAELLTAGLRALGRAK